MPAMTVTLPAELEDFIACKVQEGAFASEEAAVSAAVEQMKNSDVDYARMCARFSAEIDVGWEQAKAGRLTSAENFEVEFEEYKRQWLASRERT